MSNLNSISVVNINTKKEESTYHTEIRWTTDPVDYHGTITIALKQDGVELKQYTTPNVNAYRLNDADIKWDLSHVYSIVLTAQENIASREEQLLLKSYDNVSGWYDGDALSIQLEADGNDITQGFIVLSTKSRNISMAVKNQLRVRLEAPAFLWQEEEQAVLEVTPYSDSYISGPSLLVQVPLVGANLVSVNEIKEEEEQITVSVVYEGSKLLEKTAFLMLGNQKIKRAKSVVEQENNNLQIVFEKKDLICADMLTNCRIELQSRVGNMETTFKNEDCTMSLFRIEGMKLDWCGTTAILSWNNCFPSDHQMYQLQIRDGEKVERLYANRNAVKISADLLTDTSQIQICPMHGLRCGWPSELYDVFQPGFYMFSDEQNMDRIGFKSLGAQEQQMFFLFEQELFPVFDNPVQEGGFRLEKLDSGYLLSIDGTNAVDLETFRLFISKLASDEYQCFPTGLYSLLDCLGRVLNVKLEEQFLFAFGFDRENRFVDLRPGMILCVSSQHYEVGGTDGSAACGYLMGGQEQYKLCVTGSGARSRLSFHPFLEEITKNVIISGAGNESGGIGGLVDFFCKDVMYSYFRLQYPFNIQQPSLTVSADYRNRPVLLGSVSYPDLLDISDNYVRQMDIKAYQDVGNALFFRGRTTLSVMIHVYVQERQCQVPLGTTLMQLLVMENLYDIKQIRLYRSIGAGTLTDASGQKIMDKGGYVPVYIQRVEESQWEEIVLFSGDQVRLLRD